MITDSASDIPVEHEQKYGITVLPFKIAIAGRTYVSRKDFTNEEFYKMLEKSTEIPRTAQITAFEFGELYEELYAQGVTDAVLVLINAEGSATYNNACMAKKSFFEQGPDRAEKMRIHLLDGRSYTYAYGYPVVVGARMAQEGHTAEEIVAFIRNWLERSAIYAGLYTLKYAGKSGRIPSVAAFVGDALGMKPIMRICDHGITTRDKVRGERAILPMVMRRVTEQMEPNSPYCVGYGNDPILRDQMLQLAEETIGYPPAEVFQLGAEITANSGPRITGVLFLRKAEFCTAETTK